MASSTFQGTSRFLLRRHLGCGGFGTVYHVHDLEFGRDVALKVLHDPSPEALLRFKREFRFLAEVRHPNLVRLYELISEGGAWFFTMELIEGAPLLAHLRGKQGVDSPIWAAQTSEISEDSSEDREDAAPSPPIARERIGEVREIFAQLARGIAALHEHRILHRDIKPSNILVTPEGRVVLLDFGLIAELSGEETRSKRKSSLIGTLWYMSPEQTARHPLSEASDWYSMGVILYEVLTGVHPFRDLSLHALLYNRPVPPPPLDLVPHLPPELSALAIGLLALDPSRRPKFPEIMTALLATAAGGRRAGAGRRGKKTPFVGRSEIVARLHEHFEEARKGAGRLVVLHGTSGIGKTALLTRFLEEIRRRPDTLILEGRCFERERLPFKTLDGVIDRLSLALDALSPLERHTLFPEDIGSLSRLFPVLRRLPVIAEDTGMAEIPDARELRRRGFAALKTLLFRLARRRGIVVAIDDLQWGDVDSLLFLLESLLPPDPVPMLLLLVHRTEERDRSPALGQLLRFRKDFPLSAVEIELPPLSEEEAVRLVEEHLGEGKGIDAARLVRESRGSPFFLHEFLRDIEEGGGRKEGMPSGASLTLEKVLERRMGRLSVEERSVLDLLAVAGVPIPVCVIPEILARDAGPQRQPDWEALDALSLLSFSEEGGETVVNLYHDRIRHFLLERMPPKKRQGLHLRIAEYFVEMPGTDPGFLATHFLGGGMGEIGASHALKAAKEAERALAFETAAFFYGQALAHGRFDAEGRRALSFRQAEALRNAGRSAEAATAYLAAVPPGDSLQARELQRRAAEELLRCGHLAEGEALLEELLRCSGIRDLRRPWATWVSFFLQRLRLAFRGLHTTPHAAQEIPPERLFEIDLCWSATIGLLSDTVRAATFQGRFLRLALDVGEPLRVSRALAAEACSISIAGSRREKAAKRCLEISRTFAEATGHPHAVGLATAAAGISSYLRGDWQTARRSCETADRIFREACAGSFWEVSTLHTFLLGSLFYLGEFRELSRRAFPLLRDAQRRGDRYTETNIRVAYASMARLATDAPEEALDIVEEAMEGWPAHGFQLQHYLELYMRTSIDLYRGEGMSAWERFERRWRGVQRSFFLAIKLVRLQFLHLRAASGLAVCRKNGPSPALLRRVRSDARKIHRAGEAWAIPLAHTLEAAMASLQGERRKAAAALQEAIAGFEAKGMRIYAAAARRTLGRLVGGSEGNALATAGTSLMSTEGIANPSRMTAMLLPGFEEGEGEGEGEG